ncbi:protein kinase protein with tetratricopeptiderepeat domain [Striga asiatica]|uniref:Protein kinase protein with tetratricopeptiderepeat domain n=1 Tax=Striga asiatica TaxID=4170 RepID=A0A5A7QNZ1_STRAF|nr:protein kinase protein with tetratricopeptiderepeat domain [Striga asiatica]
MPLERTEKDWKRYEELLAAKQDKQEKVQSGTVEGPFVAMGSEQEAGHLSSGSVQPIIRCFDEAVLEEREKPSPSKLKASLLPHQKEASAANEANARTANANARSTTGSSICSAGA